MGIKRGAVFAIKSGPIALEARAAFFDAKGSKTRAILEGALVQLFQRSGESDVT